MLPETKIAIVIAGSFSADGENADPNMLLDYIPEELAKRCEIKEWSNQPSTYYSMSMTLALEEMFEGLAEEGYAGIIAVCGSGVMAEMTYFVNLLWQKDEPVIFTNLTVQGRAGVAEGLKNLHCAVLAATSPSIRGMGALLCSSGELFAADDVTLADPSSADAAFQSVSKGSVAKMLNGEIVVLRSPRRPPFLLRRPKELPDVEIVWASLGAGENILNLLAQDKELKGVVLAGFGSGNVPPVWMPPVRNILRRHVPVVITSRCIQSSVRETSDFEGSFKKLDEIKVISGDKLNPMQARLRLSLGIAAGLTDDGLSLYMRNMPVGEESPAIYK